MIDLYLIHVIIDVIAEDIYSEKLESDLLKRLPLVKTMKKDLTEISEQ